MDILVSGSLAYDRIMDFPGRFADHIMPDKIHMINVSFTVNSLTEKFGGTAGNIAYSLSLLGAKPRILATIGHDYHRYFQWLEERALSVEDILIVPEESTASAYITTDLDGNQITEFNPGSMKYPSRFDFGRVDAPGSIAIVGPGNLQDMADYCHSCHDRGIFLIFDPGQSLPMWDKQGLTSCILQSRLLVSNDYELELMKDKTGLSTASILERVDNIVTTKGERGAEVLSQQGAVQVPAIPTPKVLDPTGAGDAFRGGLIKGLTQRYSAERAAMMGTLCAYYAIQVYGTQEYTFTTEEFAAGLERHFGPWPAPEAS